MSDPRDSSGRPRTALLLALVAASLILAIEWFQTSLLSDPPPGVRPHGVVGDGHLVLMGGVYGGFVRESIEGGGLWMHNHQTAVPHAPALARPKEWLVGKAMAFLGLDPLHSLRVERALAIPIFVIGTWLLARTFTRRRSTAWVFLIGLALGGNLYWLVGAIPGSESVAGAWRSWLTEGDLGLTGSGYSIPALLIASPHLIFEVGFFCLTLAAACRASEGRSLAWAASGGVSLLCLGSVRPYTVPVAVVAILLAEIPRLRRAEDRSGALWRLALLGLPVLPLVVHLYGVLSGDTIFSSLDVKHPAPPPHEILLFLGLPAFLVPWLWWKGRRIAFNADGGIAFNAGGGAARSADGTVQRRLLLGWGIANVALVHGGDLVAWEVEAMLPLVPLALLLALRAFEPFGGHRAAWTALLLLHVGGGFAWVAEAWGRRDDASSGLYVLEAEWEALRHLAWTRDTASLTADDPPTVLLCNGDLGPLVPWLGGTRVVVGHFDHTPEFARRRGFLRRFLRGAVPLAAARAEGATHLLDGPRERQVATGPVEAAAGLPLDWEGPEARLVRLDVPQGWTPPAPDEQQ